MDRYTKEQRIEIFELKKKLAIQLLRGLWPINLMINCVVCVIKCLHTSDRELDLHVLCRLRTAIVHVLKALHLPLSAERWWHKIFLLKITLPRVGIDLALRTWKATHLTSMSRSPQLRSRNRRILVLKFQVDGANATINSPKMGSQSPH